LTPPPLAPAANAGAASTDRRDNRGLERHRRRPYAGAVGCALPNGAFEACITTRTFVLADGMARLQARPGIVADSDSAAEHEECQRKLAVLEAAIDRAEQHGGAA
jgi:anthranilate synthase component 1